jgi:hypothetical protein
MLERDPDGFLRTYPIKIFGATSASGVQSYAMINRGVSLRPGHILGTHRMHETESFDIRSVAAMGAIGPLTARYAFLAHSIHMDLGTAQMKFYRLGAGGPPIMVTGELSGCSFVMVDAGGGQVDVAHVKPTGQIGKDLFGNLSRVKDFVVYGAGGTHGNYDSDTRLASIVGVRDGAQWRIFAQKRDKDAEDIRIVSAYQVYPKRQKL